MRHNATCALMYFITLLCGMQTALAQPGQDALATLTTRAQTAFNQGQTDEAIRLYLQAYSTVDQDPSLLYNVAFIYEQTGRVKEAGDMYRQVARAPRSSPALRVKAYERRDQLPAARATVPLLEKRIARPVKRAPVKRAPVKRAPVKRAPVKRAPVRRAPVTAAPALPPVRIVAPKSAAAPTAAAAAAPATKEEAPNRRLSPEQRRRLELRRRRARAKKGL